jgi:anti-sigma-K factor RskA
MSDIGNTGPFEMDRDAQVAEYVLGTLTAAARDAFEAELARDTELQRRVAAWAARLQPLADSVAPVAPPPALRERVLSGVTPRGTPEEPPFKVARWLAWTFGLSAIAGAVAAALVILLTPQPPRLGGYAMLHDPKGSDSVVVFQIDKERQGAVVLASAPAAETGHDYELWVLPPGKTPISLGVVKAGKRDERPLLPSIATQMKEGASLAVSLEPAGGAPAGAPTGPIVFTGTLHLVGN